MAAFANPPPKRPVPVAKEDEPPKKSEASPSISESFPIVKTEPAGVKPAARVSAKRQQELDEINKMMEEDDPEGKDHPGPYE